MKTHVAGQVAAVTALPTLHLGTYRRNILAVVLRNDLFTAEEQLRANHCVHECTCPQRLAQWLRNVRRVAGEREQAQQLARFSQAIERGEVLVAQAPRYATPAQCDELYRLACHPALSPADKTHTLALLPTLTEGAAVATIGQLYARVLSPAGQNWWRPTSTLAAA